MLKSEEEIEHIAQEEVLSLCGTPSEVNIIILLRSSLAARMHLANFEIQKIFQGMIGFKNSSNNLSKVQYYSKLLINIE